MRTHRIPRSVQGREGSTLERFVVTDDLGDDEVEEVGGELRIEIGVYGERLQPRDLTRLLAQGRQVAARVRL